jgi:LuxR family maltose regulon positive regulatory protein
MPNVRRSDQPSAIVGGRSDPRRLLERSPSARITVVTAPAGSAKSEVVREWLAERSPDGRAADWIRIDLGPEDRHPTPAGRTVRQRAVDEAISWLSQAARVRPRFVLTGLEMLTAEETTQLVGRLQALPSRARTVLVGAGNGLPAGCQVRLGADLVEVRSPDLWWNRAELIDQVARVTGITATSAEADQLFRLTGGWPAGVVILARAMRSGPAVLTVPDPTEVPEILDFVTTEVLDRLDPAVRQFVLRTAVLEDLEADDCAALLPDGIVPALLAQVHQQGLTRALWPPVEAGGPRYHPLVRAAALRQLRSADPGAERDLLRAAGEQARRRGREPVALTYLAAAGDWDAVLSILFAAAAHGFRGWEPSRLRAAVRGLPERTWGQDAERRALVAFAAGMSGDHLLAAQILQQTPDALREGAGWWSVLARMIEALPGPAGGVHGGYRAACTALTELRTLDRSIAIPPILGVVDRPSLVGTAHLLAARAGVFDREQAGVRRHLEAGWSEVGAQIPRYCVLAGLGADALTAAWGGQLAAARRRATRAQRLADEAGLSEHPMLGLARLAQVEVLRARGHSAPALAELASAEPGFARGEAFVAAVSGGRVHLAAAQILRATLHLDLAEPEAARAELERLDAEGDDDPPRNLQAARAVAWARLHLLSDDVAAAEQVLTAAPETGTVVSARIEAALHRQAPEEAQAILQRWPFEDTLDNRIRRLLTVAAIAIALDRRPEAVDQIDQALVAAEPDGHLRIFLDAPPRARAMASAMLKRSLDSSGWRAELAERLDQVRALTPAGPSVPVTRRERAVLEHLTTSMTHAQIASQLFVSDNTLKSHCRNLYRKLGVNTRADAIRAARARGWLEPAPEVRPGPGTGPGGPGPDADSSPPGDVVLDLNITPVPVVVEL